jgi:hypothetical protein
LFLNKECHYLWTKLSSCTVRNTNKSDTNLSLIYEKKEKLATTRP